ncbi:MAG: peptidase S8, partial [Planctomycetota bacterium JB042]
PPDPGALLSTDEPHERGAILVAAVFDAFLSIYRSRIDDLLRIATQGSGLLAPGELHPDLVKRLAKEASTAADHVLRICIRALDYCPPVDITFGDYLRALITADVDAVPDDRMHYRLAFVEAFQRRGIYPGDVRTLSEESLVWRPPRSHDVDLTPLFAPGAGIEPEWRQTSDRRELWERMRRNARTVHRWLRTSCSGPMAEEIGLAISTDAPKSVFRRHGRPTIEVHSVRLARRGTPLGDTRTDFVIEILQRRRGYLDAETQARVDAEGPDREDDHGDFVMRGGCTLLVDPETCRVRYAINKHILSAGRLKRQREFLGGGDGSLRATYLGDAGRGAGMREPFAMLHRPIDEQEGTT